MIDEKKSNPLLFLSSDELQHAVTLADALQSVETSSTEIVPEIDIVMTEDLMSYKTFDIGVLGGLYLFYKRQPDLEGAIAYAELAANMIRTRSAGTYSSMARHG